jgi:hypothetical protein
MNLGLAIDHLVELRAKKTEAQHVADKLKVAYGELEEDIRKELKKLGLDKGSGRKGTAAVRKLTVANVKDWDAFWKWIAKTKNFHLIQQRVSDPAYREVLALKGMIPGTEPFEKETLSLTTLKKGA